METFSLSLTLSLQVYYYHVTSRSELQQVNHGLMSLRSDAAAL